MVVYGEHKVIEPSTDASSDEQAAKMRTSNPALLDVISEEDAGGGGNGATDGQFGSRGSLSMITNRDDDDDEDVEMENDLGGSRTSLGSASMKRWTTEGNLSLEGSREDKMDMIDGPMHNSHSNSTGECSLLAVAATAASFHPAELSIPPELLQPFAVGSSWKSQKFC